MVDTRDTVGVSGRCQRSPKFPTLDH
jgi:hypothetical protein